jgi:hypothetical protein
MNVVQRTTGVKMIPLTEEETIRLIEEEMIHLIEGEMIRLTGGDPMTVLTGVVTMIRLTEGSPVTLWTGEVPTILLIPIDHVIRKCLTHLPNITTCLLPECRTGDAALHVTPRTSDIIKSATDRIATQGCKA